MKLKVRNYLLGIYDLILAVGAIYTGLLMIRSDSGIFLEYPLEWSSRTPFHSWVAPGILIILLFGIGNIAASLLCFMNENGKNWFISGIMGTFTLLSILLQIIILGESYMASLQFSILGFIQVALSLYTHTKSVPE